MGFALLSLMAYMFFPTIIIYWLGMWLFRARSLTRLSKATGFAIALPCAAIAAIILAPTPSPASAESMLWQGSAIGAVIGAAIVLLTGRQKKT